MPASFRVTLEEWLATVPRAMRESPVWRVRAYQIGSYIGATAVRDVGPLVGDPRFIELIPQLVEAANSIPANITEGYARRSRADRIRYYEYALGSANESQSWYLPLIPSLGRAVIDTRLEYLARVRQLLLVMIGNERKGLTWGSTRRIPRKPEG